MSVKNDVEYILKNKPDARNSDKKLLIYYMQLKGMQLSEDQMKRFYDMASPETIRRTRQSLQEEGKYPADKEVEQSRYNKFVDMKQNISSTKNPEQYLEGLGYRVLPYGE